MPDLLVRDIDDDLKRLIEDRARSHRRSLSDEVKALLRERLVQTHDGRKLGSEMFNLVRPEKSARRRISNDLAGHERCFRADQTAT